MVTFSDEIHPKYGLKVRFEYSPRALQYLMFFKIVTVHPSYMFLPLNLTFESNDELYQFLTTKDIISDEVEINDYTSQVIKKITVVDTRKIYDVEESITKYLLNYKFYSINEVAEMISMSRPTIYKLVSQQTLKAIRIYGQLRINHLDLMKFLNPEK